MLPTLRGVSNLVRAQPTTQAARRHLRFLQLKLAGTMPEDRDVSGARNKLGEELEPLAGELGVLEAQSSEVATWPGEGLDETKPDGVACTRHDDRRRLGRLLEREQGQAP